MTLSRWRRVATGIAAGVIVLSAALLGASFRDDGAGVSVASDLRPTNVIPIEDEPIEDEPNETDAGDSADTSDTTESGETEPVQVIDTEDLPDPDESDDSTADEVADTSETPDSASDDADSAETDTSGEDTAAGDATTDGTATPATDGSESDAAPGSDSTETDDADSGETAEEPATDSGDTAANEPAAPITAADDALGTGGGVDDAECALDRLVIYAGARRGGVAGSIRSALARAGFGAGCPAPPVVLASNCPQQFAGVLGAGSGYDPNKSYVAASASVDRETMTAVMGSIGYSGNAIDILDFGFVNPDAPGEQWIAIFVPPSFAGWEDLAARAGLSPTSTSLCAPSGELAG